jgi:hypothetical protein
MNHTTSPKNMSEEEKSQIVTAAFCAYIMLMRGCKQDEGLKIMSALCAQTQAALFGPQRRMN